jgi:hypothetical protein
MAVSTTAVAHDAGAVNVVVSGPLFKRLQPEREVAVGMLFTCEEFEAYDQNAHSGTYPFAKTDPPLNRLDPNTTSSQGYIRAEKLKTGSYLGRYPLWGRLYGRILKRAKPLKRNEG